ncbi:MAG: hypothetical protein QY331_03610 [Melioribacteraceae bacterium]|nr:MAG: hypothetical protein QY331_03610 [Melioribacteraceae bacterium]
MQKFTISVKKVHQSTVKKFDELELFHFECNNYGIKMEKLNPLTWGLKCKRCKRQIIVKDNAYGNLPIMQTAVDGEERLFNHELAKETVKAKS